MMIFSYDPYEAAPYLDVTSEWRTFLFVYFMSVCNVVFCYINGIVLICDWNDVVWNENTERLSLKKNQEIV